METFPLPEVKPEKLNGWDRLFNRKRKLPKTIGGRENWYKSCPYTYEKRKGSDYIRVYNEYYVIDRVTGSITVEKIYEYHDRYGN